jgi:hypothetical protein
MQYRICGGLPARPEPALTRLAGMRWRQVAAATADIVIDMEIPQLVMWATITRG